MHLSSLNLHYIYDDIIFFQKYHQFTLILVHHHLVVLILCAKQLIRYQCALVWIISLDRHQIVEQNALSIPTAQTAKLASIANVKIPVLGPADFKPCVMFINIPLCAVARKVILAIHLRVVMLLKL